MSGKTPNKSKWKAAIERDDANTDNESDAKSVYPNVIPVGGSAGSGYDCLKNVNVYRHGKETGSKAEADQKSAKSSIEKEKAAKKIVKSMGDKKKYDSVNQIKTLIVMQVLGNTKTFFDSQKELNDRENFFSNVSIPDAVISDNNIAGYLLFGGSDGLMQEIIDSQWQK